MMAQPDQSAPAQPVPEVEPVHWRHETRVALVTGVALILCGAPMGVAWAWLAPRLDIPAVVAGSESAFAVQFDQDLVYLALGVLVGVAAGWIAYRFAAAHGTGVVVGLAVGGVLAGLIAATVGHRYRMPGLLSYIKPGLDTQTRAQTVSLIAFELRASAFALAVPVAALLTVLARLYYAGRDAVNPTATPDGAVSQPGGPGPASSVVADPWWSAPR